MSPGNRNSEWSVCIMDEQVIELEYVEESELRDLPLMIDLPD
jgi:hypothetical protein